jgi:S-adenosylmethionine decarboxylase
MLTDMDFCRQVFDDIVIDLALTKLGEVYHSFPGAGYTAVVCLTESHVSIHTWPEHNVATFDVFLSNFENDNSGKVKLFFDLVILKMTGTIVHKQEIIR